MMAKITKGRSFGGAVKYILDPQKQAELLCAEGLRIKDLEAMGRSFQTQASLNPRVSSPVGHISLDFSAQDRDNLTNEKMVAIAREYMERMGIRDTQFLVGRHHDREHPHIHLLYNRVDNNGRTISDQHDRTRSTKICRELTEKHGLYISSGKENVKRQRLREPDATKYLIYDILCKHVPQSRSWNELERRLKTEGIEVGFKTKGSTDQIEGVRFTMNNLSFNGSKVDRQFSYSKIDCALQQNARQAESHEHVSLPTIDISGGLGLIQQHGPDYEEEEFRRLQQKTKKKKQQFKM